MDYRKTISPQETQNLIFRLVNTVDDEVRLRKTYSLFVTVPTEGWRGTVSRIWEFLRKASLQILFGQRETATYLRYQRAAREQEEEKERAKRKIQKMRLIERRIQAEVREICGQDYIDLPAWAVRDIPRTPQGSAPAGKVFPGKDSKAGQPSLHSLRAL